MRITYKNEGPFSLIFIIISSNGLRLGSDKKLVEGRLCLYVIINSVLLQELHLDEEYTLPEMLLTLLDTQMLDTQMLDTQVDLGLATCTLRGSLWASIVLAIAV